MNWPEWTTDDGRIRLINADCLEVLPTLTGIDAVVTDPPYPNRAGHFLDGIETAREFCSTGFVAHWIVFWDDVEVPPVPFSLVARHSWYRTNTNRPDNCEAVYEFHADGQRRPSRVFPYCVICDGLTGIEATGHPTEKHAGLMVDLVRRTHGTILDPFAGSFTTAIACIRTGRRFIGIEKEEKYWRIGIERVKKELGRTVLFDEPKMRQAELIV